MTTVHTIMARAMQESKAWPAVFEAGSAAELTQAALAALDAAGFAIVPKTPTRKMLNAAKAATPTAAHMPRGPGAIDVLLTRDYTAMLAEVGK